MPFHTREIAFVLNLTGKAAKQCGKVVAQLYKAFTEKDASLLEINPLVVTQDDDIVVLDAKMSFDSFDF